MMKTLSVLGLALIIAVLAVAVVKRDSLREHRARAFARAAWDGDVGRMRLWRFLGADPKGPAPGMAPPLLGAAVSGKVEAIRYLLDCGVDVEQRDKWGNTPLIEAAYEGHLEAVRYLLDSGAKVNSAGEDGSALRLAIMKKHSDVAELLRQHGGLDCVGMDHPIFSCE
jgi:ankyrin repeat protein